MTFPPSCVTFPPPCMTFPRATRAPARRLLRARARWRVRLCTDSGLSPPTLEGHFRMTNRRRTRETGFPDIRGQGRAIHQQGHSAPPRLPTDVGQELGEHEQRALQPALAAPQGGVPMMALAQHCHQPWRHPGSDDHRSPSAAVVFSPSLLRGCASKETAIARIAPVAVSVVFRERAALAVDLEPDHLPAGAAWQYESTCDRLATPLPCKRDERRVGRRQLEAAIDWSVESTKACATPFAGTGERGAPTSKAKAASLLCANFQLRAPGASRGRPLLAMSLTPYPPPPRCAALTRFKFHLRDPADRNRVEKLTFTYTGERPFGRLDQDCKTAGVSFGMSLTACLGNKRSFPAETSR